MAARFLHAPGHADRGQGGRARQAADPQCRRARHRPAHPWPSSDPDASRRLSRARSDAPRARRGHDLAGPARGPGVAGRWTGSVRLRARRLADARPHRAGRDEQRHQPRRRPHDHRLRGLQGARGPAAGCHEPRALLRSGLLPGQGPRVRSRHLPRASAIGDVVEPRPPARGRPPGRCRSALSGARARCSAPCRRHARGTPDGGDLVLDATWIQADLHEGRHPLRVARPGLWVRASRDSCRAVRARGDRARELRFGPARSDDSRLEPDVHAGVSRPGHSARPVRHARRGRHARLSLPRSDPRADGDARPARGGAGWRAEDGGEGLWKPPARGRGCSSSPSTSGRAESWWITRRSPASWRPW